MARKNPPLTGRKLEQNPEYGEAHLPKAGWLETEKEREESSETYICRRFIHLTKAYKLTLIKIQIQDIADI